MRIKHKMLCIVPGGVNIHCNCYYITFIFFLPWIIQFVLINSVFNYDLVNYVVDYVFNVLNGNDRIFLVTRFSIVLINSQRQTAYIVIYFS